MKVTPPGEQNEDAGLVRKSSAFKQLMGQLNKRAPKSGFDRSVSNKQRGLGKPSSLSGKKLVGDRNPMPESYT